MPNSAIQRLAQGQLAWLPQICHQRMPLGFTLAELLIALAILGVIATFTIPKIMNSTQNSQNNAITKETAAMISAAFQQYTLNNTLSSGTTLGAITPYMNYVKTDNTSTINANGALAPGATVGCNFAGGQCLVLHNGAKMLLLPSISFAGTGTTNAIWFHLDPDGTANNANAIVLFLYYNGKITSYANIPAGTVSSDNTRNAAADPDWFSNWN